MATGAATAPAVLDGVRVLEVAHMVAAPTCGTILADLGADVVKVEAPGGDLTRGFGPQLAGGTTAMFAGINRSKRGVVADLRDPADTGRLRTLLADADVLLTNLDTVLLERAGIGAAGRADLVQVRVAAFADGSRPGTDSLAQTHTGMTAATGDPDRCGVRTGPPVVDVATGVWCALAVLAALEHRRRTGEGQIVDLSLEDVALHLQHTYLAMAAADLGSVDRRGNHSPIVCTPVLPTATDRLFLSLVTDRHWRSLLSEIGRPDLADDDRFDSAPRRQANQPAIEAELAPAFGADPARAWSTRLTARGIPHAIERDYPAVLADPGLRNRQALVEVPGPGGERSLQVLLPLRMSRSRVRAPTAAPSLDPGATPRWRDRTDTDRTGSIPHA